MKFVNCKKYEGSKLPPCVDLLGNANPITKDGKIIFRNLNRLYYFICLEPNEDKDPKIYLNIQISLPTYIIGLVLDLIDSKKIDYSADFIIHSKEDVNKFIHKSIKEPTKLKSEYKTFLSLVYSNGNAILTPFMYKVDITLNNFLILLSINRIESNPSLLFINNSEALEDIFNFILADIDLCFNNNKDNKTADKNSS
ncbi:MAG: hypothetical protein WC006_02575 [Bacilli bacterium]